MTSAADTTRATASPAPTLIRELPAPLPPAAPRPIETPPAEELGEEPGAELARRLARKIQAGTASVGVVGMGSVGVPLAAAFAHAGHDVVGFDVDGERLATLDRGELPFDYMEEVLLDDLASRFRISDDPADMGSVDALILCVPTPLRDGDPDLSHVEAAARTAAAHMTRGQLVVLESTTYPGTTRDVVGEIFRAAGLVAGEDYFLAYSPEREDPGRREHTTRTLPKLVGGTCEMSGELARQLYSRAVLEVHRVSCAEVAEAAKLFENVFRAVNIALVNELKVVLDRLDIDVWEVCEAAGTKPFGFMKFEPGPGTGGQCIPIDPGYLSWIARRSGGKAELIEAAGRINRSMPGYVIERARQALAAVGRDLSETRVLVLGLAYKKNVDIVTGSPSIPLIEGLRARGAAVDYCDPHVPVVPETPEASGLGDLRSVELDAASLGEYDVVVLATDHACFEYETIAAQARLVIDTRNALAPWMQGRPNYLKA